MRIDSFRGEHHFLSNFYPHPFILEGIRYGTAEHAYQAHKASIETDRWNVVFAATAAEAKRVGRTLTLSPDWESQKWDVMRKVLAAKFENPYLRAQLLATDDAELVEGNHWHDQVWGDCTCPRHVDTPGANELGKALMELRGRI